MKPIKANIMQSCIMTYCRISFQSGCSPLLPGRPACMRHGSSKTQAFVPSSDRICFSAIDTSTATRDTVNACDPASLLSGVERRVRVA